MRPSTDAKDAQDKRQQQLQTDFADLLQVTFRAVHVHQQANQQRGDENP
jgi:hypothetical protein